MRPTRPSVSRLPGIAFATLPSTGETIAIRHGERVYYRVETTKTAEALNAMYGVSQAQAEAMLAGLLRGWDAPRAEPGETDANGASPAGPQGVGQVSP